MTSPLTYEELAIQSKLASNCDLVQVEKCTGLFCKYKYQFL